MSETTEFLNEYANKSYAESLIPEGVQPVVFSSLDDFMSTAPSFLMGLVNEASQLVGSGISKAFGTIHMVGGYVYDMAIFYDKTIINNDHHRHAACDWRTFCYGL